jgi:hypothetical protein
MLDGWQAGLVAVVVAGAAVALTAPRAVEPRELPAPIVDERSLAETARADDERAALAEQQGLNPDVREVGTELRQYNAAAAERREADLVASRRRLLAAVAKALEGRERELLAMRAYQTRRFLEELRAWQQTGTASRELIELGGDFVETMLRNGWCDGSERRLLADDRVLRIFFKQRWNSVTGADAGVFALTRDEDRLRLAFFLQRPWVDREEPPPSTPIERVRWEASRNRKRLTTIDRLAQIDPSYPADLARGVVLYRTNQLPGAAEAFRRQLERSGEGPYVLRARNYLKATLERMSAAQL